MNILVKAERLSGKKVIGSNGNILGEVSGVELDVSSWKANYLYIDVSEDTAKELGIKSSFWSATTVCMPITVISQVGDVITLNVSSLQGVVVDPQKAASEPTPMAAT